VDLPSSDLSFNASSSCISLHRGSKEDELLLIECGDTELSRDSEIWIFNCANETWSQYETSPINIDLHTAALNQKGDILWVHDIWEAIYKIDLCTDEYEIVENVGHSGYDCESAVIRNTFHVIQARTRTHLQWDDECDCFKELSPPPLEIATDVRHHCLVSINETLLIFEGPTQSQFKSGIQRLYQYDPTLPNNPWTCISLEVPIPLFCPKAIAIDNRFVILFGWEINCEIFVLDTYTMRTRQSKARIPNLGKCELVIAQRDEGKKGVMVAGFIRNLWKEVDGYPNIDHPPSCLITLLATFYADDTAYLTGNNLMMSARGIVACDLCRIKVDSIFEFH